MWLTAELNSYNATHLGIVVLRGTSRIFRSGVYRFGTCKLGSSRTSYTHHRRCRSDLAPIPFAPHLLCPALSANQLKYSYQPRVITLN